jgi:SAM-dependent methyltransferase
MIRGVSRSVRSYLARLQSLRGYRSSIDLQYAAPDVEITRGMKCIVSVKNVGEQLWRAGGWYPVHLSYHWRRSGATIEGLRFPLPADIRPGEQAVLECAVLAPPVEGDYQLEFDLVREHVGWFGQNGSPTATVSRRVSDYDYQISYAAADLERDYWTIVGPATREQYEHLGRQKCQTLIELGMTPHSRVLDVGCGTGQLTEPLAGYLSDEGAYLGTDIVDAAVAFCRKKFTRPNFTFAVNGMTGVDTGGRKFDIIYLSSVFTHMYPPEIKSMLLNLKDALAPGGFIMADVFVTPHVSTFHGSRSKVEINEDHLRALIADTGLMSEVQGTIVHPAGVKRVGFLFRMEQAK